MKKVIRIILVSIFSTLVLIGCSKNISLEECGKLNKLSEGSYFNTLLGQETFKSLIISNYVNYEDEKLKEIIKIMLIENDLDALTVNNSIASYCQQIGFKYYD